MIMKITALPSVAPKTTFLERRLEDNDFGCMVFS
jgi:hypothetical protein